MNYTQDKQAKTLTIQYDDIDEAIYSDQFPGGILEGVESLLTQNRQQRRDIIANEALRNTQGPVSYTDKDDLVSQRLSRPGYENAAARKAKG